MILAIDEISKKSYYISCMHLNIEKMLIHIIEVIVAVIFYPR